MDSIDKDQKFNNTKAKLVCFLLSKYVIFFFFLKAAISLENNIIYLQCHNIPALGCLETGQQSKTYCIC